MADFSNVKQSHRDTAEYKFWNVVGEPILIVKHTGEANKPYFNEVLRRAQHQQKRKAELNVALLADNRDRDRDLFPKFVVVGWKDVVDASGTPVSFSKEDCLGWLKVLDDDEFDGLREFCRERTNFRAVSDGASAAGNSQTV